MTVSSFSKQYNTEQLW